MEASILKELEAFRHELHRNPELSESEHETQIRIESFLSNHGISNFRRVGHTGIVASFDTGKPGPCVLIRGDIDALPIQEINTFDYRSTNDGVAHKCGHDGHTTILSGLAIKLKEQPITQGQVHLLFQPAEENGMGAKSVLNDPDFNISPDWVFALHNLPGYPLHQVVCREGAFTPSVKSIIIKLTGKTAHAAEPELGHNPANAIQQIIQVFEQLTQPNIEQNDFALCTPIYIQMGDKAYGTSAGHAEVHYTLRTWSNDIMAEMCQTAIKKIEAIAQEENLKLAIDWTEEFAANINETKAVETIKNAASELSLSYTNRDQPFKWGEDFGIFTDKFKGAMFGIGSGENCPALHNPDYDFPDEIIPTGINMFFTIIQNTLK